MDTLHYADHAGGLSALPQAPIEAATIDGASRWQIFRHIQLPMLFPLIVVAVMLRGIDASKVFDTIYVLTGGGPGNATEVISTFAYRTNFIRWDLGYGAAVCLVLAFASLVVAALFFKTVSGKPKPVEEPHDHRAQPLRAPAGHVRDPSSRAGWGWR